VPLVLIVALLSVCVAVVLAGYAWHAYKGKRKIVQPKSNVLRQVVEQPTGEREPSSQSEELELASVGSKSTRDASEAHPIHIAASFSPVEPSVETVFAPCAPEPLPQIAEIATNLIAVEEPNGTDLTIGGEPEQVATKMQDHPLVEGTVPQDEEDFDSETASEPTEIYKPSSKKTQTGQPNTRRISPEKRGGRMRGWAEGRTRGQTRKSLLRTPRPEIVCWKRDREWILAVEIPEVVTTVSVLQNGMPIREDELEKGCWQLAEDHGEVTFTGEDERTDHFGIEVGDESCLVFKLSGLERNRGRRVKNPTKGSFLVIAPTDWERDESESGPAPARPEYVCLEGYRAHFFNLEGGSEQRIALRDSIGRSHMIGSNEVCFQLVGKELSDASEVAGSLFGCLPPRIRINNGNWESVETIVLGEEGRGRGRWRSGFQPDPTLTEQDIAAEIADRGTGWYFVRFYDSQDDFIDSLDFRFCPGLQRIAIPRSDPLPSPEGHRELIVEFQHDSHCRVHDNALSPAQVERSEGRTILKIPPEQKADRTHWFVGDGRTHVTVTILAERVWWGLGRVNELPTQWSDSCLFLPRDSFAATSEDAVWIRLPKPRWIDRLLVGFQQSKWREYMPKVEENTVVIAFVTSRIHRNLLIARKTMFLESGQS